MAIMTRWRMPPESWCGYSSSRRPASAMRTRSSISRARSRAARHGHAQMAHDVLGDLRADGQHRIEAGHRLLEDHRDAMAAQALHRLLAERRQLLALEADRARGDAAGLRSGSGAGWRAPSPTCRSPICPRCPASRPRAEVERHAVDGAHHAVQRVELRVQVADLEDGAHSRLASRGSSRSRRPSPSRFTASTVMARNAPGIRMVQGAIWKKVRPWAMMLPQLGTSGGTPAPRKLRARLDQHRRGADVGRLHDQRRQRVGQRRGATAAWRSCVPPAMALSM